jgi:hypothetical protein
VPVKTTRRYLGEKSPSRGGTFGRLAIFAPTVGADEEVKSSALT